jgi:hypothetical protein
LGTFANPNGGGEMENAKAKRGIISISVILIRIGIPRTVAILKDQAIK